MSQCGVLREGLEVVGVVRTLQQQPQPQASLSEQISGRGRITQLIAQHELLDTLRQQSGGILSLGDAKQGLYST